MLGNVFTLVTKLPKVLGIVTAVVGGVEYLAAAVKATGDEKRDLAVERATAQLERVGLHLSEQVLGALVDISVWLLNKFTRKRWSEDVKAEAANAKLAEGENASDRGDDPERRMAELEADARDEFEAVKRKRESGS